MSTLLVFLAIEVAVLGATVLFLRGAGGNYNAITRNANGAVCEPA